MLFFEKRRQEMSLLHLLVFRYIRKRDVIARGSLYLSTQSFALTQGSPASSAWRNGAEGEHCAREGGKGRD